MLTHSLTLLPGGGGGSGGALSTALYDFDGQDGELSFKVLYIGPKTQKNCRSSLVMLNTRVC